MLDKVLSQLCLKKIAHNPTPNSNPNHKRGTIFLGAIVRTPLEKLF